MKTKHEASSFLWSTRRALWRAFFLIAAGVSTNTVTKAVGLAAEIETVCNKKANRASKRIVGRHLKRTFHCGSGTGLGWANTF
jgi:hypothetical protein